MLDVLGGIVAEGEHHMQLASVVDVLGSGRVGRRVILSCSNDYLSIGVYHDAISAAHDSTFSAESASGASIA